MRKKLRVIVLMGGKSPEHEVSLSSGKMVLQALTPERYETVPVIVSRDGEGYEKIFNLKPDVVFIAIHGPFGEDGTVQGLLELAGVPYTGAGVLASALGMDKPIFRELIGKRGIPTPKSLVVKENENFEEILPILGLPVVVKPSSQGSSVGVSIVRDRDQLPPALKKAFKYGPRVLVDEYLSGVEVSCGVLGSNKPFALPVIEIVPKNDFFDYEAKYTPGMSKEIVPARISAALTKLVQKLALEVYQAINCRGFGRVDMIISQEKPFVLEINTIPGLTPTSLLPQEASAVGISFSRLIEKIIDFALE